jgi:hypothetical protein
LLDAFTCVNVVKLTPSLLFCTSKYLLSISEDVDHFEVLEKELKALQKENSLLFKKMHKYSKEQFEEKEDILSKKMLAATEKLKAGYNDLLEKLNNLQTAQRL